MTKSNLVKRILIIDDEPDIVKVLAARLKDDRLIIETAHSGAEGLLKIAQNIPDLMIIDIMMPDMDGNELAEHLKENKKTANIPVIFLTALQTKDTDKKHGHGEGEMIVFAKPYDINEVINKIAEILF